MASPGLSWDMQDLHSSLEHMRFGMWNLVPWPGIEPRPPCTEVLATGPPEKSPETFHSFFFFLLLFFFIVVDFVIHWNESAMGLHVFPIPIPPPTSLSTHSLEVFPVHQVRARVSCIQPGLVICFTLDNICVSMLFSWNIPPSPSPTESKRLFYKSVSLFLFCI